MDATFDQQLHIAFYQLCTIADYYANTPPDYVKPDFKDEIKYLHVWPGHVRKMEKELNREAKIEFRLQTRMIKPLVNDLWNALNKAQKCDRKKNWDSFIDHMGIVWDCSWGLINALDC